MKVTSKKNHHFQPITIEITVENSQELDTLIRLTQLNVSIPKLYDREHKKTDRPDYQTDIDIIKLFLDGIRDELMKSE